MSLQQMGLPDAAAPDPVSTIPAVIDSCVITMQNRLEKVQAILRKDPDAFEGDESKMEFDMLNSLYQSVQNVAYHLNKVVLRLNPREEKWPRPQEGIDALDVVS